MAIRPYFPFLRYARRYHPSLSADINSRKVPTQVHLPFLLTEVQKEFLSVFYGDVFIS